MKKDVFYFCKDCLNYKYYDFLCKINDEDDKNYLEIYFDDTCALKIKKATILKA